MQVNRASSTAMRTGSIRMDAASAAVPNVAGVAPAAAAEDSLSDEPPPSAFLPYAADEDGAPERMIDAIDPELAYRAAVSLLRRQGMVGLLLNRNA
jgi:hypothetical protein